jgi:heme O synthase-like polyprenyltransferase
MIISIPISDTVVRAAQDRKMTLEEFVDMLIDKGMETATGRPMVTSAIDRIRALHTDVGVPRR